MLIRQFVFYFLLIFCFKALLSSCSEDRNLTDLQKSYIQQPVNQSKSSRNWKEYNFSIVAVAESFFGNITSLHLTPDHEIYFGDRDEKVIRKFDLNLNQVDYFGKGRGSGPGEFHRFYNAVFIDAASNIWVADEDNGRITIINVNSKEWETINAEQPIRHVIPLLDGKYALDHPQLGELSLYDTSHKKLKTFEAFIDSPENWQILMQGSFDVAADFSIIKSHYFTNDFIRYSSNGDIIYFRRPIEPSPAISIRLEDNPNDIRDKAEIFKILYYANDIRIADDQIHILISRSVNGYRTNDFVDVYRLDTGDYLYSYRLPKALSDFAVNEKYLVGLTEETGHLMVWEIDNSNPK